MGTLPAHCLEAILYPQEFGGGEEGVLQVIQSAGHHGDLETQMPRREAVRAALSGCPPSALEGCSWIYSLIQLNSAGARSAPGTGACDSFTSETDNP